MINNLKTGHIISNDKIVNLFNCSPRGDIRRSWIGNSLVIINNPFAHSYKSIWDGNVLYFYREAKKGKHSLSIFENRALSESLTNDIQVYLFEVIDRGQYLFLGEVDCIDTPYIEERKNEEKLYCVFPLHLKIINRVDYPIILSKEYSVARKTNEFSPDYIIEKWPYSVSNYKYPELEIAQIGVTKLKGQDKLPLWTILDYFENTAGNHMKLSILGRIIELLDMNVPQDNIYLASKSIDVTYKENVASRNFDHFFELGYEKKQMDKFWEYFELINRPYVFYFNNGLEIGLYDIFGDEALRIKYYTENSPINVNLEGGLSSLSDLYYAKEREERARDDFKNLSIGKAIQNINSIVSASEKLETACIPLRQKMYLQHQIKLLIENQAKLNEKIGIVSTHIDTRV